MSVFPSCVASGNMDHSIASRSHVASAALSVTTGHFPLARSTPAEQAPGFPHPSAVTIESPLSVSIPVSLKAKIWAGEYVELGSLIRGARIPGQVSTWS